jgi:hypothetical protein
MPCIFGLFHSIKRRPQVDNPVFIWYIRALEVEGMAVLSALRFTRIPIRSIEEDAACRFSFAIITSIRLSRR